MPKRRLPIPIEKRWTPMPRILAATRCPNSWTVTTSPQEITNPRMSEMMPCNALGGWRCLRSAIHERGRPFLRGVQGGADLFKGRVPRRAQIVQNALQDQRYIGETDSPRQEGLHGDLVGGGE